jgi:hypothetical protein
VRFVSEPQKQMKADATLSADTEAYVADGFGAEALF